MTEDQAQEDVSHRPISKWAGRGMGSGRCREEPPPELRLGIEQFNRHEFFECHETLEEIWIEEDNPIRYLYQGILKVGVGFHHALRGNHHGAVVVMSGGIELLTPFRPRCMGVDVDALSLSAERAVDEFNRLGPSRISQFDRTFIPQISLSSV